MTADEAAGELTRLYLAKAEAERVEADASDPTSTVCGSSGTAGAAVLVLKGASVSSRDRAHRSPLAPEEAEALSKALEALELPANDVAVVCTRPHSVGGETAAERLALTVEACDPAWVIALDRDAGADAALVLGVDALLPGSPRLAAGRVWLVVDDLEASLSDPVRKRAVWAQLKTLATILPDGWPRTSGRGAAGREP